VRLYRTMISYAGTYTVNAEKVVHHVDISWNQNWTGTDQVRFYKLEGNTLTITSTPAKNFTDGREGRARMGRVTTLRNDENGFRLLRIKARGHGTPG
jgi:hypothetical protein